MKVMCDQCGVKEATKHYQDQYLCDSCYVDIVFPEYAEFKKEHPFLLGCLLPMLLVVVIFAFLAYLVK